MYPPLGLGLTAGATAMRYLYDNYGKNIDMLIKATAAEKGANKILANKVPGTVMPGVPGTIMPGVPTTQGLPNTGFSIEPQGGMPGGTFANRTLYEQALQDHMNQYGVSAGQPDIGDGMYHGINWNDLNEPPRDWY